MSKFNFKNYRLEDIDEHDPKKYDIVSYKGNSYFTISKTSRATITVDDIAKEDGSKEILISLVVDGVCKKFIETNTNDIKNLDVNSLMENLMVFDYCCHHHNPLLKKADVQRFGEELFENLDKLSVKEQTKRTPEQIVGEKFYDKAYNRSLKYSQKEQSDWLYNQAPKMWGE